jgi:hypothetical protein
MFSTVTAQAHRKTRWHPRRHEITRIFELQFGDAVTRTTTGELLVMAGMRVCGHATNLRALIAQHPDDRCRYPSETGTHTHTRIQRNARI